MRKPTIIMLYIDILRLPLHVTVTIVKQFKVKQNTVDSKYIIIQRALNFYCTKYRIRCNACMRLIPSENLLHPPCLMLFLLED